LISLIARTSDAFANHPVIIGSMPPRRSGEICN
jgi:hypothetical protein